MAKTTMPQHNPLILTKDSILKKPGKAAGRAVKTSKIAKWSKPEMLKPEKIKQYREHPLSVLFSASIEQSRDQIMESTIPTYDSVYNDLSMNLLNINEVSAIQEDAVTNVSMELTTPFKDEELNWTSADGMQSGTVSLGNRMKKLQKAVDAEQKELQREWDEWMEAENEIEDLVAEFAEMSYEEEENAAGISMEDVLTADQREMMEEIKAEKVRVAKLIEQAGKDSLRLMEESEKKLDLGQKNAEDKFLALLREDDYLWDGY